MKKIKSLNGYTIYQLTARDEKNGEGFEGEYNIYFSSDIRAYGREYSEPEFTGVDSLEVAEELCGNNYAIAKELCEAESTCVSFEEIEAKCEELDKAQTQEEKKMENTKKFYYGNEVSEYGKNNGYVDYRCFAKAFDAVLNNDLMQELETKGFYFELVGGLVDNSEEIEELEAKIEELEEKAGELEEGEELEEIEAEIETLEAEKSELEDAEGYPTTDVYQFYIISDNAVRILEENNEIVWYCEELDLYIWGVTHWGTSWDYVLTNIKIDW